MKDLILKRERIFHFFSLALIAVSMFLEDPIQKITVLITGILGLIFLSVLKKQKILIIVYFLLLIGALAFFYFKMKDNPAIF